jgi:hypothetical protein
MNDWQGEEAPVGRSSWRRWWWGGIAVVVLLLCVAFLLATTGGEEPSAEDSPPPTTSTPVAYKALALGENATLRSGVPTRDSGERGEVVAAFAITKTTVDPPCAAQPGSGAAHHTLLLDVAVRTFGFPAGGMPLRITSTLNPYAFQTQAAGQPPRGTTAGVCLSGITPLPDTYGPDNGYLGQLLLEVDDASGVLLLTSGFSPDGGWKWTY